MLSHPHSAAVHPPRLLTFNFLVLSTGHLLFALSFWPYVLLPVFLQDLGADLLQVGIIMGIASLAGFVIRPMVGSGLDRTGRRSWVFIGGLIFLASHLLYLAIDRIGWGIYAVRLVHGIGMGILMAAFFTLAADFSPPSRRAEGIALFGIAGHLAGAIGVLLGEEILKRGGYPLQFKICALLAALILPVGFYIKEPPKQTGVSGEGFLQVAMKRSIRVPSLGTLAFAVAVTSYMIFLKPYAISVGLASVSYFFLAYSSAAIAVRLVGAHWPERFGLKRVLYPSQFFTAAGILLISLWPARNGLVLSGVLCGIGHGFIFPILSVLIISRAEDRYRGTLMALFTLLYDVGIFIGAPFFGWVAQWGGYRAMFSAAALVVLASWIGFVFFDEKDDGPDRP